MPDAPPRVTLVTHKRWYRSRTLWFNAAGGALLLVDAAASNLGALQPVVPAGAWPYMVAALSIGNVWLRTITTTGITLRKTQ